MKIRTATDQDRDTISAIYRSAFAEGESELIARLAIELLDESSTPETVSLLAESGASVVGHVAFSPVGIEGNAHCQGYILAPLAVQADFQQQGFGSALVEYGMQQLAAKGVNVVLVYGDPKYYTRFGFDADSVRNYTAPYTLEYPFAWQAAVLNQCLLKKTPAAISCVSSLNNPELW